MFADFLCFACGSHFIEQISNCCAQGDITCPRCGAKNVLKIDTSSFATGG